jgi:hypothetical protein
MRLAEKRYMGEPCPHGHSGERYVNSRHCCECTAISRNKALANGYQDPRRPKKEKTQPVLRPVAPLAVIAAPGITLAQLMGRR